MASRRGKARRRVKRPKGAKSGRPGTKVRIKGHVRTPRGPNKGKKPVIVKGYSRRKPRKR